MKNIDEDIASGYLNPNEVDGVVKLERTLKAYPMWKLGMKDSADISSPVATPTTCPSNSSSRTGTPKRTPRNPEPAASGSTSLTN